MAAITAGALSFASSPDPYNWDLPEKRLIEKLRSYVDPARGLAYVLQVENTIAGFIAARFDELDPKKKDRAAWIDLLAVGPEHRGKGFGTHLARELLLRAPDFGVTRLQVNVDGTNEAALRFWRRTGLAERFVTMAVDLTDRN